MKYKLKEEAKQFFAEHTHSLHTTSDEWMLKHGIHPNLLEAAPTPKTFLEYGYSAIDSDQRHNAQFSLKTTMSKHYFTLVTENTDYKLHNYITNNKEELTKLLNETVQVFIKNNNLN